MMKLEQLTLALTLLVSASVAGQESSMVGDPTDPEVRSSDTGLVGDLVAGREKAKDVCAACHGLDGNAFIPEYPDLAGQNAAYLAYALRAYQQRHRFDGNAGIMIPQAEGLSAQDIADLAAYYSSLGE